MSSKTILLVEDNMDDAELTMLAFENSHIDGHIVHVRDGVEALEFLSRPDAAQPAVVILDLKLPRLNGFQVLERLRANHQTRHLPVVVISSSDVEEDIRRSYERGANSYVRKVLDFGEAARAICQITQYWLALNQPSPAQKAAS